MLASIAHRGPDDEGLYTAGPVGLGNRRLSIIDLDGGRQPMCNEDGSLWIVYNGEIYNYRQLRAGLEKDGHRLRTASDTEVILHLYEQYGEECVQHLSGMFAFAIWDSGSQKLFLARDRIGQKPLYYALENGCFYFASEPKAILSAVSRAPEMDLEALHNYLSLRFIPAPSTMFSGIKKLPAAHCMIFQDGNIRTWRYWELTFRKKLSLNKEELLDGLEEKLAGVVQSHLVSDVPVGAFLSGGLDSSLIVALLAQNLQEHPQAFAIGVQESDFDELPYARMVAEHHKVALVEEKVAAHLIQSLARIIWHLDEPSDPIAACMYEAARLAARHVKVVLGGDGGDELFAGFDRYTGDRYLNTYRRIPRWLRQQVFGRLILSLPDSFTYKSLTQKMRWVHQVGMPDSAADRYAEATLFFRFNQQDKQALYQPGLWRQVGEIDSARIISAPYSNGHAEATLDRMLYSDYLTRLPEHSLQLVDRMTMAHGLEARSPFLDHQLVEYLAQVPAEIKVQRGQPKYLMRKLAEKYLPEAIVKRDKQGFMFPIAYWFRTDLYPFLSDTLLNGYFIREGLFSKAAVQRLLEEHRARRVDHHVRLWMLLNLEVWQRLYILGWGLDRLETELQTAAAV